MTEKQKQIRAIVLKYKLLCRVEQPQVKLRTDRGMFYESQFTAMASTRWTGKKPVCP